MDTIDFIMIFICSLSLLGFSSDPHRAGTWLAFGFPFHQPCFGLIHNQPALGGCSKGPEGVNILVDLLLSRCNDSRNGSEKENANPGKPWAPINIGRMCCFCAFTRPNPSLFWLTLVRFARCSPRTALPFAETRAAQTFGGQASR